jgi:hypothetical protein
MPGVDRAAERLGDGDDLGGALRRAGQRPRLRGHRNVGGLGREL